MAPRFTLAQDFRFFIPTCSTRVFAKQPSLPLSFIFYLALLTTSELDVLQDVLQCEAHRPCHQDVVLLLPSWQWHSWQAERLQWQIPECQTPTHTQTYLTPLLGRVLAGSLTKLEKWILGAPSADLCIFLTVCISISFLQNFNDFSYCMCRISGA